MIEIIEYMVHILCAASKFSCDYYMLSGATSLQNLSTTLHRISVYSFRNVWVDSMTRSHPWTDTVLCVFHFNLDIQETVLICMGYVPCRCPDLAKYFARGTKCPSTAIFKFAGRI